MEGVYGVGGGRGGGGGGGGGEGGVDNAMMAMDNGGDGTRCFRPRRLLFFIRPLFLYCS